MRLNSVWRTWTPLAAMVLAVTFWGCDTHGRRAMPTNGDGMGALAVRLGAEGSPETPRSVLRDAGRGEIQALYVTVTGAQAIPVCPADSTCEPMELLSAPVTVDVIQLGGEVTIELSNCDLPVGDYTGVSLDIESAMLVLADSTELDLPLCEGASPLLIEVPFTITEDGIVRVMLHLNHENLISRDRTGGYLFCPDLGGDNGGDDDDHGDDDHGDDGGDDDDHGDDGDDHDDHRGWWF